MKKSKNKQTISLTNEKFLEIYSNEQFRNQVAHAHQFTNSNGTVLGRQTCSYPVRYIVTDEQIDLAKKELEKSKVEKFQNLGNKLVFVGMGCDYKARYENDVCNHRIRTSIVNPNGRNFFIEVGTWGEELMGIDHVIDRDLKNEYQEKLIYWRNVIEENGGFVKVPRESAMFIEYQKYQSQPYYWYKKEEWQSLRTKYTTENVIKLVNSLFDCNFQEMEVDNYTLRFDDFKCVSPVQIVK